MPRLLVLFAHPALEKSRVHRRLAASAQALARTLPGSVTFHDLYEEYPDFDVDPRREQALLEAHDVVLFQFPIYWYAPPALIKQWEDLVLEHGWAYGTGGTRLRGKHLGCVATTGGRAAAYAAGALNRFTIREFLLPLDQTAVLCGMRFLPPYLIQGTHLMEPPAIEEHATHYAATLAALARGEVSLERALTLDRLNDAVATPHAGGAHVG
ncbi:MAG TPA: NAD(P)H-dependent oxidoreductase [Gemmatimonadaceae bacterium]|nr:NAD(P)H-dependent oxidoreductase [Gemmatimonadaceae bacterium]